jgi:hypothetical protein
MQRIARTRSRVWFSIAFKKVPDRGSQIQQVAVFIGDKGLGNLQKETTAARIEHGRD